MKKKLGQAFGYWVKIIIGVLLGLLVFSIFTGGIASLLKSSCLRETENELKPLVEFNTLSRQPPLLGSADEFYLPFTARGSCVRKVIFAGSDGYSKCRQVCSEYFGVAQDQSGKLEERCLTHCTKCEGKEGCIIVVTKRPSYWNYALPWRVWETYKRRTDTISTFGSDYGFGDCNFPGCELEAPRKGSKLYCLIFRKQVEYYSIEANEIESKSDCQY